MSYASIEIIARGRVAPLTGITEDAIGVGGSFDGGVYYEDGAICKNGLQIKAARNIPLPIDGAKLAQVKGHHLFGGLLQNEHFGHFLVESLSRLWGFDKLGSRYDTVAYYLRRPHLPIAPFVTEMLQILIPGIKLHIVKDPTEFETLAVPQQLVQNGSGYMFGHPMIASMCKRLRLSGGAGAKKVYVSRSKISKYAGGILGDYLIDQYLEDAGYKIVYPETMSIRDQLATYSEAEQLIFTEGSALHLYALVANPTQRAFMIHRRVNTGLPFDWQIRSFGGPKLQGDPFVEKLWVPQHQAPNAAQAKAIINFGALSQQLHDYGFVASPPWPQPNTENLEKLIVEIEAEKTHWKFVSVPI
jgi:hypothetical protein